MPYSHHPYAYALSNPVIWSDPTGKCAVDDAGGLRACKPAELSFEEQLAAVLDNYGLYADLYDEATQTRGANALNLVFDRNPDQAQSYQVGESLQRLIEEKYPFLDADGVGYEVTRALGTWRLDAISRGATCDTTAILAAAGLIGGAAARQGGPGELLSPDTGGGGGRSRRAPEFLGGQITEGQFVGSALDYLGSDYRELSPGRYVSSDGMRQVRYGSDEVDGPIHHAHFEAYDRSYYNGGSVVENTRVIIIP